MPQLCQEVKFSFGKRFSWIPLLTRPGPRQKLPILEIYKNHTLYIKQVICWKFEIWYVKTYTYVVSENLPISIKNPLKLP